MSSFPVWVEVVCAKCARTIYGEYSLTGQIPVRELKKHSKYVGAVFDHKEAFCCQNCLDEFAANIK